MDSSDTLRLLSTPIKISIVAHRSSGLSLREISNRVEAEYSRNVGPSTIRKIILKWDEDNTVKNKWSHAGAPRKVFERDEREIIRETLKDRFSTSLELTRLFNLTRPENPISRATTNNILLKNGYKACKLLKKPDISQVNKRKRLDFAKTFKNWKTEEWSGVIFSDESLFRLSGNGGIKRIRRRPDEAYKFYHLSNQSDTQGVMIWGAIFSDGVGPIVRINSNVTGDVYKTILEENLLQNYPGIQEYGLIFQQDNAPAHRFGPVKDWFNDNDIEVLDWPPQSPDINIIEHVWAWLAKKLAGRKFRDTDELWNQLRELWYSIPDEFVLSLYKSLPNRMLSIIKNKGGPTKY